MNKKSDKELEDFVDGMLQSVPLAVSGFQFFPEGVEDIMEPGLTHQQFLVLNKLLADGDITMGALSERMRVTSGAVTRMIGRLVEKDLVERSRDHEDRRVVVITLSGKGRALLEKVLRHNRKMMRFLFEEVSKQDRKTFLRIMNDIEKRLD